MLDIIVLGTLDSKLEEILYLREQILEQSKRASTQVKVTLIDCGRQAASHDAITISQATLARDYASGDDRDLNNLPRGDVINFMASCAAKCVTKLVEQGSVHGIVSAGGSGGSTLACSVMRDAVPIGLPKLMVSTVASGDTGPLVGETDITMMYSVADISGSNSLLRGILSNAAGAVLGMAAAFEAATAATDAVISQKNRIGITMFGVTTAGVDKIRQHLESNYEVEVYIFHATGHGGRAMERLVEEDRLDAVLDLTTTEICDHLMGGNMSAGGKRLEAALKQGIPTIISLGATDMVNFGPRATVPPKYKDRKLYEHNATVTLMRTTAEECSQIGGYIVDKIKKSAKRPEQVELWIPKGGVSLIAVPGGAFEDAAADAATAEVISRGLKGTGVHVVQDERAINDEGFATDIADSLMRLVSGK